MTADVGLRLLCIGLATSLDRYLWMPSFQVGMINRPTKVLELAGGKALNVARAAAGLGLGNVKQDWPQRARLIWPQWA